MTTTTAPHDGAHWNHGDAMRRMSVPALSLEDLLESFDTYTARMTAADDGGDDGLTMRRASVLLSEALQQGMDNTLRAGALSEKHCGLLTEIGAQARNGAGSARLAEELYNILRQECPDVFRTPTVLNTMLDCHAKCSDGSASVAARILAEALEAGYKVDTITYNTAINVLAKCADGSARRAHEVLRRMRLEGVEPNLVTYNSVIDAQSRRQDGSARIALDLLSEMMRAGDITPDLSTFTSVINLQARLADGSASAAFNVLDQMRSAGIPPNTIILNSVIDAQAKRRDGRACVALLVLDAMRAATQQEVKPNVVTYTSAIDCCAKCEDGDGSTAVELLEEMTTIGLQPNHMTYGTAINCQAKRGSARVASAILKKMIMAKVQTNVVAFNSVLHAQAKCDDGSATEALLVLESMKALGIKPNIITYTSAIDAQAKKSDGAAETAAQLLEEAVTQGLRPDTVTFTAVLDAQAKRKDGSPKRAAAILDMMIDSDIVKPNHIHYNSALNACANARPSDIATAVRILARANSALAPNNYTLSALLRCCAFSEPPQPDLAAKLFREYSRQMQINDHVERALCMAVPEALAHDLFRAIGHTPRRRSISCCVGGFDGNRRRSSTWRQPPTSLQYAQASDEGSSGISSDEEPTGGHHHHRQRYRRQSVNQRRSSSCWRDFGTNVTRAHQQHSFDNLHRRASTQLLPTSPPSESGYSSTSSTSPASSPPNRRHSISTTRMYAGADGVGSGRRMSTFGETIDEASRLAHIALSTVTGERRNSLAGVHASEAMASPSLPAHTVAGLTSALNTRSPSEESDGASSCTSTDSTSSGGVGIIGQGRPRRRMSLAEKVRQIKANAGMSEEAGNAAIAPADVPVKQKRSSALMSPDFFTQARSTSLQKQQMPDTTKNAAKNIIRPPLGPDGSRGFGERRRSSLSTQMLAVKA